MFHFVGISLNPSNDVYRISGLGAPYNRMDELQSSVLPYCIPNQKGSDICSHHSPLHRDSTDNTDSNPSVSGVRVSRDPAPGRCSFQNCSVHSRPVQTIRVRIQSNLFYSSVFKPKQFYLRPSLLTSHNRHAAAIVHDFPDSFPVTV